MWNNICMKIGIIGNGNHSKRIQKILKKKKLKFFLYKPSKPHYFEKEKFQELKKCNTIFIISPNGTHYNYIKQLKNHRYIYCEKPPVNTMNDLKKLKKIKSNKIYFNFNYRYKKIAELISKKDKFNMGELISANLLFSHGLALKKDYINNWRSDFKKCPKGVYELVSIHLIDLVNYVFDIKKIEDPELLNLSKKGNSFDTSAVKIKLKNNCEVNIFSTYNAPMTKKFLFLFKNGIIEQRNNLITIEGPAINLDKKGLFKRPKLIKKYYVNDKKDSEQSLYKSVSFFLDTVSKNKNFIKNLWKCSIKSNTLIL